MSASYRKFVITDLDQVGILLNLRLLKAKKIAFSFSCEVMKLKGRSIKPDLSNQWVILAKRDIDGSRIIL